MCTENPSALHAIAEQYFSQHLTRKLHLGCGNNILPDWLNSDVVPCSDNVLQLNVTQCFPFADESFDYIFSEHLIEHITYEQGLHKLTQCHRLLKPGGKLRVSTPNLEFLINLFRRDRTKRENDYIRWSMQTFFPRVDISDPTFVLNNFVRNWGHIFVYTPRILVHSLQTAGFAKVCSWPLNQSGDTHLQNLENEQRLPRGFLELETFTLEASK
ncbi:class I SAM-dependent methyltransferase [Fundidesulfovibrio putealis]|uniref:class I SAM-dependent methyltransferase n=1 Tax=Fundidesulfovibrio putealis TaxID=270496 RepID=UPI000482B1D5|nr:methyltransferase domain-containing protein [Fundidesulfovibrio putealis]